MSPRALWQRLLRWFHDEKVCYLYTCSTEMMRAAAPPPHPDLSVIVCDDLSLAAVKVIIPNFPALIESRVRRGDLALLAATPQEWVFRSTAVLGPRTYAISGYPLTLSEQDAYLEYAETIPSWRGKGVAPGMLGPTATELMQRGVTRVFMKIDTTNTASCRAAEKGGAIRLGILRARRFCGHWRAVLESLTPKVGVS